jgi:uncharacterized protein
MRAMSSLTRAPALAARGLILVYRYTLSAVMGRRCRMMPSCSEYTDEAIARHGLWAGGWMGVARICRCRPGGTSGLDWVPERLPGEGAWYRPWRYGRWRTTHVPVCEAADADGAASKRQ